MSKKFNLKIFGMSRLDRNLYIFLAKNLPGSAINLLEDFYETFTTTKL